MFAEIKINLINNFPMPFDEALSAAQKKICQRLVSLADQMLEAQIKLRDSIMIAERTAKQRTAILDSQIDALVYELYGLTAEEIAIIEGQQWNRKNWDRTTNRFSTKKSERKAVFITRHST